MKSKKKKLFVLGFSLLIAALPLSVLAVDRPASKTIPLEVLKDKIKGGWAGQTIGVSFGGPTEFKYNGTFIPDYQTIPWYDGYIKEWMDKFPGLFDDIYMDFTFVEVLEREGLDAPVESFAMAFANADYPLWHANQAARYNIVNGIMPPLSGHWLNNPHADDIDYQIEADFAGLMSPGMPNAASEISDKIGHIMNFGDGWYGGVFVGAMYALAFVSDDIHYIVREALQTVPKESDFHQCIADAIAWHAQYPDDWKQTWFELLKKWNDEVGCPDGVFSSFNIDAKMNAAYIVLGLLYGEGDYTKTLEISTRAGQDSDCNPSNAAGILGTMLGYSNIPDYWKMGLSEVEDVNFVHTSMSLNDIYKVSYKHALEMIARNGGSVDGNTATIQVQKPEPVRYEKSFEGHYPIERIGVNKNLNPSFSFEFEGVGIVLTGAAQKRAGVTEDHNFILEAFVNGEKVSDFSMSTNSHIRRPEIFWMYQLPKGKHTVEVVIKNPKDGYYVRARDFIIYSDAPAQGIRAHIDR